MFNGFAATHGELPNELWIEELAQLQPRDIQKGIEAVKRSGSDFAPSLPKFLKLCEPVIVEDVKKNERETYLMIEQRKNKTSSAEVRKQALAEMNNLLKFPTN